MIGCGLAQAALEMDPHGSPSLPSAVPLHTPSPRKERGSPGVTAGIMETPQRSQQFSTDLGSLVPHSTPEGTDEARAIVVIIIK